MSEGFKKSEAMAMFLTFLDGTEGELQFDKESKTKIEIIN